MRAKWFFIDLYRDIVYGRWVVRRSKNALAVMCGELRVTRYDYYAACWRTGDMILCESKREAEGIVACRNDHRGQ